MTTARRTVVRARTIVAATAVLFVALVTVGLTSGFVTIGTHPHLLIAVGHIAVEFGSNAGPVVFFPWA